MARRRGASASCVRLGTMEYSVIERTRSARFPPVRNRYPGLLLASVPGDRTIRSMAVSETSGSSGLGPEERAELQRLLPSVGRILELPEIVRLFGLYGRESVTVQVRTEVQQIRDLISGLSEGVEPGSAAQVAPQRPTTQRAESPTADAILVRSQEVPSRVALQLRRHFGGALRRVINATGVFLHTNLGRAPLPPDVVAEMPPFLDAYCDLEMDLGTGKRADRNTRVEKLLCALTGADAAVVVNNNAAALVLMLQSAARDREVVVSRGELVEIGGSFRIPSILETAGTRLREVGTTNRTRIEDYEQAIGPETGALLKVHPSNYKIQGFVEETSAESLVELGRRSGVPVLIDEGSGLLRPSDAPQLRDHASLQELVAAGVEAACGSGDKLVGGPQAGLIVGQGDFVEKLKRHPLYRALRPNRATLFALEAVLRKHLIEESLPISRLWTTEENLRKRLEPLAERLGAEIIASDAFVGGGAAPEAPIPGLALAIRGSDPLLKALRTGEPSVVGYLREGCMVLDVRTVDPEDDNLLANAVEAAIQRSAEAS